MEPKRGRKELMTKMKEADPFFKEFGLLDDKAFEEGAIPKKYKELSMVAISIQASCKECIEFHISEAIKAGAGKAELIEAIKMGMMAGGSLTYPYIRHAFDVFFDGGRGDRITRFSFNALLHMFPSLSQSSLFRY